MCATLCGISGRALHNNHKSAVQSCKHKQRLRETALTILPHLAPGCHTSSPPGEVVEFPEPSSLYDSDSDGNLGMLLCGNFRLLPDTNS